MRCKLLLFAHLAEAAKTRELELELPDDATVSDAIDELARAIESLALLRDPIAIAVNQRYVRPTHALKEGDIIALIPPVSGG